MKPIDVLVTGTDKLALDRRVVVHFTNMATGNRRRVDVSGGHFRVEELPPGDYRMQVFAAGYQLVGRIITVHEGGGEKIDVMLPVKPDLASAVFPTYGQLPADVIKLISPAQYEKLTDLQKAGFLNVATKARAEGWIDLFYNVIEVKQDRVIFRVAANLPGLVDLKYKEVNGSLHKVEGYALAGSYKSNDLFGNIQLTFFVNPAATIILADVDIDDAAGFRHVFQVIHNAHAGPTHPYNIREILLGKQGLNPGYRLDV